MAFLADEKKWVFALIDYHNTLNVPESHMNRLLDIKNTGDILQSDLILLNDFKRFLDDAEREKLTEYITHFFGNTEYRTIKELRTLSGMTQLKFSELFGIPRRTLQAWELGQNPAPLYLVKLIEYYLFHENIIETAEN